MAGKFEISFIFKHITGKKIITGDEHFGRDFELSLYKIIQIFLTFETHFSIKFPKKIVREVRTFNGLYGELERLIDEQKKPDTNF